MSKRQRCESNIEEQVPSRYAENWTDHKAVRDRSNLEIEEEKRDRNRSNLEIEEEKRDRKREWLHEQEMLATWHPEIRIKIKFKKLWFVLLVLPLVFTPISLKAGIEGGIGPLGITLWPPIILPITGDMYSVRSEWWPVHSFDWEVKRVASKSFVFIDWGRIAYWEAWVLTICFVVNRKRLMAKRRFHNGKHY